MRRSSIILALTAWTPAAFAQLYLLTGAPNPRGAGTYPMSLWLAEDDDVSIVDYIVQAHIGTEWVAVNYDWRRAVILTSGSPSKLIVVDFDKAAVAKTCIVPDSGDRSLINSWLADAPAPGPSYEWLETGTDVIKDAVVQGMVLDPAIPCERSFARLEPEAIRYAVAHGNPGVGGVADPDGIHTNTDQDEKGSVSAWTNRNVPLGYSVPIELRRDLNFRSGRMEVNDSHVLVLLHGDRKDDYRALVFRKSDKTWHTLPRFGDHYPYIRGFGRYLAAIEVRAKSVQNPRSAGMEKWKAGADRIRPDLKSSVEEMGESYPGKLHLYDVDTERVYSISTNQGDSEVLLVENNTVYYRAADQLFSASITSQGIGPAHLLATDDSIRDAHWAFIKH